MTQLGLFRTEKAPVLVRLRDGWTRYAASEVEQEAYRLGGRLGAVPAPDAAMIQGKVTHWDSEIEASLIALDHRIDQATAAMPPAPAAGAPAGAPAPAAAAPAGAQPVAQPSQQRHGVPEEIEQAVSD